MGWIQLIGRLCSDMARMFIRLRKNLILNIMVLGIIAVSLALVCVIYMATDTLRDNARRLADDPEAMVMFKPALSWERISILHQEILSHEMVEATELLNPEQALHIYRQRHRLNEEKIFKVSPFPYSLRIKLHQGQYTETQLQQTAERWANMPGVDSADINLQLRHQVTSLSASIDTLLMVLLVLLVIGLTAVAGTSMMLSVEHNRNEIDLYRQLGASDSYIRTVFLLVGALLGLLGGLLGTLISRLCAYFLSEPISMLAILFGSSAETLELSNQTLATLMITAIAIGTIGSLFAVESHLRPRRQFWNRNFRQRLMSK